MRFGKSARRTAGFALIAVALAAAASTAEASVLNVRDEGHLHFITSSGSEIIDEGPMRGSVPGKVLVHFVYNGNPAVSARFTIYSRNGSISGKANARLNNPTSPAPSFRGAFAITAGSGRYAHIHGTGELFGVFTRRGYALVVQTIGSFHY